MRCKMIAALSALSLVSGVSGAFACNAVNRLCAPSVVVWPAYSENGHYLGMVDAPVRPPPHLDVSRSTGQPLMVVYNNPGSQPGSVDPYLHLVPLPHARRSETVGAYPVGY